jgi:hypothetical protein
MAVRDRADVSVRLLDGDPVAESRDRTVVMRRPVRIFAVQIGRHPQIDLRRETKTGGEHADHGEDLAANPQVRLRQIRRRPEILTPVTLADQGGGSGPCFRVAGAEAPSEDRRRAEDLEKIRRNHTDHRARRLRRARNGHDVGAVFRNCLKAAALVAEIVEVRIRKARRPTLRIDLEDGHDPVRRRVRQRSQQHAVDDAENGRRRADAERESENGDHRKAGMLAELPESVAAIGEQGTSSSTSTFTAKRPSPQVRGLARPLGRKTVDRGC